MIVTEIYDNIFSYITYINKICYNFILSIFVCQLEFAGNLEHCFNYLDPETSQDIFGESE